MSDSAVPRSRNIWLAISLCLNVVLIAMIVVGVWRASQREHEQSIGHAFSPKSILLHLPPDRAAEIQRVIDAHAERLGNLADDTERAKLNARRYFTAEKFDPAAYAKAQDGMLAADSAFEAERHAQMQEIARLLTPKERREIADRARAERNPSNRRHR